MERKEKLKSLLDIYNILRQDDSEYNLYKDSKTLEELIEKTKKELEELQDEG